MKTETSPHATEQLAIIGVALCETSRALDGWSRLLTGVALVDILFRLSLLWMAMPAREFCLTPLMVIFGFIQAYYALRLAFDRPVFAAWAAHPENATPEKSLQAFDAMQKPTSESTRPLSERVAGTRRLLHRQLACFAAQVFLLLVITLWMFWSSAADFLR
ncbi:hypothetical protein AGMMS49545_01900 [Betaproteobacteria bacterium]|nr:hypothetical protein AGMMS49545_01900 [Betaproteobacteria bacterium]GHU43676.1 hypothetical protein AGMMS50289_10490 [Betaproteobacteria bacterium]